MEKLLHERLREWTSDDCTAPAYVIALKDACGAAANDAFTAFADEIERYYAPYLRDENGEPVPFGTEIEWADFTTRKMTGFGVMPNGQPYVSCWNDGLGMDDVMLPIRGYLKRPTPKVYDADGVEIKVGQKRWSVDSDNEYDILEIKSDGSLVKCGCPNNNELYVWLAPSQLTHEKPVFDAEGVRICKGDTVWHVPNAKKLTVQDVDAEEKIVWCGEELDGQRIVYKAKMLTHREPDSLEKLRDDMKDVWENWTPKEMDGEWVDRLTALIERGA